MINKKHYLAATEELDSGRVDKALWAKSAAQAQGDEARTRALYIELRAREFALMRLKMATDRAKVVVNEAAATSVAAANRTAPAALVGFKRVLMFLFLIVVLAFVSGVMRELTGRQPGRAATEAPHAKPPWGYCAAGTQYNPETKFCERPPSKTIRR